MSNTKYFLLGVGTPEGREPSTPSGGVLWEAQIWKWLCLTLRTPSQHFNLSHEEKEPSAGAPPCPHAACAQSRRADQPRAVEAPLSPDLQMGLTCLAGVCHILTNTEATRPDG